MTIDSNLTISFSSILEEKAFLFAEEAVRLRYNLKSQREYHVADQFFRSATSVGANIAEANEAESRADLFINLRLRQRN
jgi:four helix bundle protein